MTYPPQQGPYGQPPGGGYGQQPPGGGYGQQPGGWQQPGWDPTAQWQQPGFPEDEPPKKRTGLIVGIIVALLLIGAVAVTGFWKPGFFLAADEKDNPGGDQPSSSAPQVPGSTAPGGPPPKPSIQPAPGSEGPAAPPPSGGGGSGDEAEVLQVAQATADGFNERDQDKFAEQFCEPEEARKLKLDSLPPDAKMTVSGDPTITGDKAKVPVEITMSGDKRSDNMPLEKRADGWCTSAD